jgi:riboflavin kinase/FMN adenylyltransferase
MIGLKKCGMLEEIMEYIAGNTEFQFKNGVVTLGKFDGIHIGHQCLINKVISYREQGYLAIMFSFLYHPYNLFSDKEFKQIYTEEEKREKIAKIGMDVLISYPFTQLTKNIEPEDFIQKILMERLDAKVIVVGEDYRFGHNRRGNVALLQQYAKIYGYRVISFQKKKWKNQIVSSSMIRNELEKGNMETVNGMLGQPYSIGGEVLHGRKVGRTLQIPTVNLIPESNKLLPPNGVYVSRTCVDGSVYDSVTNIGYKPTVGKEENKDVETHILHFHQELYGKVITVELLAYERAEHKFDSRGQLKLQMQEDIAFARRYFNK